MPEHNNKCDNCGDHTVGPTDMYCGVCEDWFRCKEISPGRAARKYQDHYAMPTILIYRN